MTPTRQYTAPRLREQWRILLWHLTGAVSSMCCIRGTSLESFASALIAGKSHFSFYFSWSEDTQSLLVTSPSHVWEVEPVWLIIASMYRCCQVRSEVLRGFSMAPNTGTTIYSCNPKAKSHLNEVWSCTQKNYFEGATKFLCYYANSW